MDRFQDISVVVRDVADFRLFGQSGVQGYIVRIRGVECSGKDCFFLLRYGGFQGGKGFRWLFFRLNLFLRCYEK
jgi:hypothetical protein